MLGRDSPQRSLFGAHLSVEHLLIPGSFNDVLYRESERLLSDDDFAACPFRLQCTTRNLEDMRRRNLSRSLAVHPLEAVLQSARAAERTPRVQALLKKRAAAERRLAFLMPGGSRQARYCGRARTEFQALTTPWS